MVRNNGGSDNERAPTATARVQGIAGQTRDSRAHVARYAKNIRQEEADAGEIVNETKRDTQAETDARDETESDETQSERTGSVRASTGPASAPALERRLYRPLSPAPEEETPVRTRWCGQVCCAHGELCGT